MNLGSMTTLVSRMVGDPDQSRYAGKYTESINLAQQQFAMESRALWKNTSITVNGGTAAYSLPTDFMWEKKIAYKGKRLDPVSRETLEISIRSERWDDDTGDPTHYIVDPEQAVKQILVYPFPPSGDAGGTLVLTYYPLPAELSGASDVPLNSSSLLAQFHMGIAAWASWLLMLYEDMTPEVAAKRLELLQTYNDAVTKAIDTFKNTALEPIRMRGGR